MFSEYAEDVTRMLEKEVFDMQKGVRLIVPQAEWVELSPHGVKKPSMIAQGNRLRSILIV